MKLSEIAQIIGAEALISDDLSIHSFSTDSRALFGRKDELFIAIKATRDGHQFIAEAFNRGVRNFLVSDKPKDVSGNFLIVENTLRALQVIAIHHRKGYEIPVVGITGSNGKTTVKEWLSTLLSHSFFVCKSPKSYNSQLGVPHSVLALQPNHEVGVFEAGISEVGEMKQLEKIIHPTIGIFTMLGAAHDDGFNSRVAKLFEKLKLFEHAERVIVRSDQPHFETIKIKLGKKLFPWSTNGKMGLEVIWDDNKIRISQECFHTSFSDPTDLENITHAIVAARFLGLAEKDIQKGLDEIKPVPMRLELKKGINDSYILDDSYNNDYEGLKVALNYLSGFNQKRKRTVILSDILSHKQSIASFDKLLEEHLIDRLIVVGNETEKFRIKVPTHHFRTTNEFLKNPPSFENEMILVKGARSFGFERIVRHLQEKVHGTRLEVNLEALRQNLNAYRELLNQNTRLMVMVKANAYGAGILEVSNFLQNQRVDILGVAYLDEAILMRKNGIHLPIMIMNPHIESFASFEKYNLQAEIFNLNHFKRLIEDTIGEVAIQIKIDTGMHRLGFSIDELKELIQLLKATPRINVVGIFTHFASSENSKDDAFTINQASVFDQAYDLVSAELSIKPLKHACNSPGIVRWSRYHYDMVRLGIGLHGYDPSGMLNLRVTSQLKTTVSQIQSLKAGETIGYSRKGIINRDSEIAILPVGYEDGFRRILGNGHGKVSISNQLYPTIGNVCMDMIMVDVTGGNVEEGDEAIIFGDLPKLEDVATASGTIPYEILTNVSSRVRRVFISE